MLKEQLLLTVLTTPGIKMLLSILLTYSVISQRTYTVGVAT